MKRTLKVLLAIASVAMLGVLSGVAVAGKDAQSDTTQPPVTSADLTTPPTAIVQTTTDAPTTTEQATTTNPTTTADPPATTTAPATTTDPGTTTAPVTTTAPPATTDGGVTQSTPQTTASPPSDPGSTTTQTQTQPCQTPTNPGVTCGNNAATQLAVVTQMCNSDATVAAAGLTVQVLNPDGSVAKTVGVDNKSICLNYSQITQIVQQICVNCTLVVQNYYSTTTNQQTIVDGWTGPRYVGYCMPADHPRQRGDGTVGWLVFLEQGQPGWDPVYAGATPAPFDRVNGYTCPGTASAAVPNTFTLTVPASLIGQFINLCLQPADPTAKPVCHSVQIDGSSKVTIPVRSNITASVTRVPKSKLVSRLNSKAAAALIANKAKKRCTAGVKTQPKAKTTAKASTKTKAQAKQCPAPKKKKGTSK